MWRQGVKFISILVIFHKEKGLKCYMDKKIDRSKRLFMRDYYLY